MVFLALGVNHHTASVTMRERLAFNPERLQTVFAECHTQPHLNNMVIVSTCNRSEIYALTEQPKQILTWMARINGLEEKILAQHLYHYQDAQAITHLMRVASGLDSLMLGEPQILGQIKTALSLAKTANMVSNELAQLFDYAFYAAKKVRSETAVGAHAVSMGYAVAQLAGQVFSHLSDLTVMMVAVGEMNTLVTKHLAQMGVTRFILCNRTRSKAEDLAIELTQTHHSLQVNIINFQDLAVNLYRADVISSCTGSLYPIIHLLDIKYALKQRKYQPMLLVDLAVPRDIEANVADLDSVYLYGIDDLQSVIDDNLSLRRQAALDAEILIAQLTAQFIEMQKIKQAGQDIAHYRQHAKHYAQQELMLAKNQLTQLTAEEVLNQFNHRLSNKMLHVPSQLLREAAKAEDPSHYLWLKDTLQKIYHQSREHYDE